MTITLDLTTIFAMLVVSMLSLCRGTHHLFIKPPKLPCQPLTFSPFLANRCLAMLPLCSAPLIALLVAGAIAVFFPCWEMDIVGYHSISYLINAHIYLVKGGRLGLLPGVLFHSCRPSFRHIGVMFLDFASLTRWGLWGPLESSL